MSQGKEYIKIFFREEVRLLKEELSEEYEADKQAALNQLSQQKELELMAAREGWQRKVEDLLEQVKHDEGEPSEYIDVKSSVLCLHDHDPYTSAGPSQSTLYRPVDV